MKSLEPVIRELLIETADATDCELTGELNADTVLLECGLDSIGFAFLVARLEEDFGFDPFVALENAEYPRTWSEFVSIYDNHASREV